MPPKLGVLAGRGPLPAQVVAAAREAGREVFVLAFEGQTDPALVAGEEHAWVPLGAMSRALRSLHAAGVEELVMIGAVRRPSLTALVTDPRTLRMLGRLGANHGDDRLLSVIVEEFESEGFRVIGVDDVCRDLLAPEGPLTRAKPDELAGQDIALGVEVARRLGELDVGQAVVVQQAHVLGVEAAEGTDALLRRCAELRRDGPGGVLVKVKKPQQERRADLPTIGAETVRGAAAAGLRGIAVETGHTLVADRRRTVEAADAAGLFIVGVAAIPG